MNKAIALKEFPFTKMQSLGNDFVIFDAIETPFDWSPSQIQTIGNRHFGIGFDQLMVLDAPQSQTVDFSYRIFNADGSEVEQCGNGLRCLVRFIQRNYMPDQQVFTLATKNRSVKAFVERDKVRVQMGKPELDTEKIQIQSLCCEESCDILAALEVDSLSVLSMGNPHAVMTVSSVDAMDVSTIGHAISTHPRFPNQTNVEFMEVMDRSHVRLRVYERGVGETLACGSGACAAVVAGYLQGSLDRQVEVALPGGCLNVGWASPEATVELTGSAEFVFTGFFSAAI